MNKKSFIVGNVLGVAALCGAFFVLHPFSAQSNSQKILGAVTSSEEAVLPTVSPTPSVELKDSPPSVVLASGGFISQTFNNCGPATLSMMMSYWGKTVDQVTLGAEMRPYQHPVGDNDDKSIFAQEFVEYAKKYGLESLARPNGSIELLKKLVVNGIPVVVRTWLHPNEDIGHFRIVRGYDDARRVLIQDDSYEGPNLEFDYDTFNSLWQPFNYGYILVYPKEKETTVRAVLDKDFEESAALKNSLKRAEQELVENQNSIYSHFNMATAYYYLGEYKKSVDEYELVESLLPWRMLWYQIEPIQAYKEVGDRDRVFAMTQEILSNNNRAFSELYQIRGELFAQEKNTEAARYEFEQALFYNKNFAPVNRALSSL